MKKITLVFVLSLMAVGFVNANGTNPESPLGMSVIKYKNIIKVFYRGEHAGKVKVAIFNAHGRMVHKETLKNTENFMRPYNFSFLPAGDYTIELSDAKGTRSQKVTYGREDEKRELHKGIADR
jgi:hypothetical protein